MKENLTNGASWNEAAKAGLILGAISSAYLGLTELFTLIGSPVLQGFLKTVCWAGKVGLCIWLMVFLMKKFAGKYSGVSNSDTFRFGARTALLSALIVAAVYAAVLIFTPPETVEQTFDAITSQLAGQLDSNSLQMMDSIKENMPVLTFFSQLIYCFTFGLILSLIVSRSVPPRNPFAVPDPEEEDSDDSVADEQ